METNRLIIRKFENNESDLSALFKLMKDEAVNKYLPWYPLVEEKEALSFFSQRILPKYESDDGYYLAICLKEDDIPIGYVIVSGDSNHDFGYGLRKEYWGKGIVTEAAEQVIKELKKKDWHYITATHDINNPGSGRVMEKLGMTYKYSYKEQWQPKDLLVTFRMYQLNFDNVDRTYDGYWKQYEDHFIEEL